MRRSASARALVAAAILLATSTVGFRENAWTAKLKTEAYADLGPAPPVKEKDKGARSPKRGSPKKASGGIVATTKGGDSDDLLVFSDVSAKMVPELDQLLKLTYLPHVSVDRTNKGDVLPLGFKVSKVYEVQNAKLENLYNEYKKEVKKDLADYSLNKCRKAHVAQPRTTRSKRLRAKLSLDPCLNEVYLYHGGPTSALRNISSHGFDILRAGQDHGTLLGPGVYMSDSSTKVDEYTVPEMSSATNRMERRFLLCKVILGRPRVLYPTREYDDALKFLQSSNQSTVVDWLKEDKRHSIVRDAEKKKPNPTFKEYAVFKAKAILPQYVVLYSRKGAAMPPTDSILPEATMLKVSGKKGGRRKKAKDLP